jgi:hypothetical protein
MTTAYELTKVEEGLKLLRDDLEVFSAHMLKVLPKAGGSPVPFLWNKAQQHIHAMLEKQLAETGYVRALILKGRQQGCSTYVGARYYHKSSMQFGQGTFIVTHEDKATANLFKMVKRYHDHNKVAPSTKASNAQELIFGLLDSGYKLATAGSKDVGRSNTARLLHGSEFAFWDNAQSHLAGIGNTIPSGSEGAGTEIILESTANGLGNAFHTMWQAAEAGEGEYIAIFVPWFWQGEYRATVNPKHVLSDEDLEYQAVYGLDAMQMQWRANKISEYGPGFEWLFDQEYPATPALAFRSPTGKPLIGPNKVMAAVNSKFRAMEGPLVIGVDPAGDGEDPSANRDRTAFAFRRGRVCFQVESYQDLGPMEIAGKLMEYVRDMKPDMIFIDKGGLGAGIYDRLSELGAPVTGVMFGSRGKATEPDGTSIYLNKRAEIWWAMGDWLSDLPVRIPNEPALIADLSAPQPIYRSDSKKQLESKKEMAKRQIRSPDLGDALALTFADQVVQRDDALGTPGGSTHRPPTKAGY